MSADAASSSKQTSDAPTLASLCADLGHDLLAVALAPRGLDVVVADAVVHDPHDALVVGPGDVVLAVGMAPAGAGALELVTAAGAAQATAVVLKRRDDPTDTLLAAAREGGVAVLTTPNEVAWGQLHALIRTSTSALVGGSPSQMSGTTIGDLFGLADAIAAIAGGPVTIEDPQSRVLAFSNLDAPIDAGRQATILGRRVPAHWLKRLRDSGVFARLEHSDEVLHIEFPGEAAPRRAISVRAGGSLLGSVWVAEGNVPLSEATDAALEEAARIAALHLLRHRVSDDLERRVSGDMVRSVLRGDGSATVLAAQLGLPAKASFAVIALQAPHGEGPSGALLKERVVELVAMYFRSFRRTVWAAAHDRFIYALVASDPGQPRESLLRLTRDAVESTAKALKVALRVGVGPSVATVEAIPISRMQAEQALRIGGRGPRPETVVDIEEVYGSALLLEITDYMADRPRSSSRPLQRLRDHDREHGTDYMSTLRAYLDFFGDTAAAVERLHVHPNTLRYRLRRIGEISGVELHDGDQRFPLELELRLQEARQRGDTPR